MSHDVVVLGGGAAGLSAALTLARSRRSVLVIDAGRPRNAPAEHAHGLLGSENRPPLELLDQARRDATAYGARIVTGTVTSVQPLGADGDAPTTGFEVAWSGGTVQARRLVVATGLVDELPEVPGLRERWGRDVLHCPYCHGWEVRDQRIGVLATSPMSVHQAQLFRQLSADVTVLAHTVTFDEERAEELGARGIAVVPGEVTRVVTEGDRLVGVSTATTDLVPFDALVVATRLTARVDVLSGLDLEIADVTMGDQVVGTRVVADATGRTSVPGVWAAGNVTDVSAQLSHSAAAGQTAAAQINAELVAEETRLAVEAVRSAR